MIIIGLTGSIAMGKSTTAQMFKKMYIPVYDADKTVHDLLQKGGEAVAEIACAFPSSVIKGAVDRAKLSAIVFNDSDKLKTLEKIVHPLVNSKRRQFLLKQRRQKSKIVVLDVPLFFETKKSYSCDYIFVTSAPRFLQRQRALARKGMTINKFKSILERQMPDYKKKQLAHFVIPTGLGKAYAYRVLRQKMSKIRVK
ncbi:dephospho-CoA kinase [Rhodospirillaceae bacterium]|nr:dephospho-CoA kinase [Rhodospirillaceae bacterium]